jgi:hypothetical protein
MTAELEETVRQTLVRLAEKIDADGPALARSVVTTPDLDRGNRRSTFVALAVAATVIVAVSIPFLVTRLGGERLVPAGPSTTAGQLTPTQYGEQLLSLVRLPPGGTELNAAPVRYLDHPQEHVLLSVRQIRVSRWFEFLQPPQRIWSWLEDSKPAGLRAEGGVGVGFPPIPYTNPTSSLVFAPAKGVPAGFSYAEIYVAVTPLGPSRTGLALFAVVAPAPPHPASEEVPSRNVSAVVYHQGNSDVVDQAILSSAQASRLASAFDALPVSTLGPHSCDPISAENPTRVTFTTSGHTWIVTLRCGELYVTRDGQHLPPRSTASAEGTGGPPGLGGFIAELRRDGIHIR